MRSPLGVLLAALTMLGAAAPADAGQYRVFGCRVPSTGASTGAPGWTASLQGAEGRTVVDDGCSEPGGALRVAITAGAVAGSYGSWTFQAPEDTTIEHARLWVYGDLGSAAGGNGPDSFEPEITGVAPIYTVVGGRTVFGHNGLTEAPTLDETSPASGEDPSLVVSLRCVRLEGLCPTDATTSMLASEVVLGDAFGPRPGTPFGSLDLATRTAPVSGTVALGITATDRGSGLRRAWLAVDGVAAAPVPFDDAGPGCAPTAGDGGIPVYAQVVPCPRSSSVSTAWDTRSVGDGQHLVQLWGEDATGNRAILSQGTVTVANVVPVPGPGTQADGGAALAADARGPVNGSIATDRARLAIGWQRGGTQVASVRAGWSPTGTNAVAGKLTDATGRPIAGAKVEVRTTALVALRSETTTLGTAWTGPSGAFTFPVPVRLGSSAVVVQWRAHLLDAAPLITSKPITRQVASGVTLRAMPRTVRRGGSVRFRGAVLGSSGVPDGVPVTVQVYGDGRWNPLPSVSAGAGGAWAKRVTFKNSRGKIRVRAVSGKAALYPYGPGTSPVVTVRVR